MPGLLPRKSARLIWLLLTLLTAAVFVRLGFWQLDRADQKQQILQNYAAAPKLQVADINADTDLYTRVSGEAVLLRQQLLLDNRIYQGKAGVHVLSPVLLGPDQLLLINRGWLPLDPARRHLPNAPVPAAAVKLSGRLAPLPQVGKRLGNQPELDPALWPQLITYADQNVIQQAYRRALNLPELQLLPYVLQLDASMQAGFAGRNWSPVNFGPKKHLAYAWQWFTLALAVLVTWLVVTRKQNKQK